MNRLHRSRRSSQQGFTLVEMAVSSFSMIVVLGGAVAVLAGSRGALEVSNTQSVLQDVGRRVLDQVLGDLRSTGLTDGAFVGVGSLPAIWERPPADLGNSTRGNLIASMDYNDVDLVDEILAYQGNGDRIARNANRVTNEIGFQMPRDLDGDGRPLDANGDLEWGPEFFSYRVIVEPNGISWLYRFTELNGAVTDTLRIAPFVSNITFDVIFNDRSLRFGEVAVVVYLQRPNGQGQTITTALEGAVVLRNTREL